jgi:hypothetical protein
VHDPDVTLPYIHSLFLDVLQLDRPSNHRDLEPDLRERRTVHEEPAVEHERGLLHLVVHALPVDFPELLPLRRDYDRLRARAGVDGRRGDGDLLLDCRCCISITGE